MRFAFRHFPLTRIHPHALAAAVAAEAAAQQGRFWDMHEPLFHRQRRSIRQAQARDKVRRNVASLVDVPEGQEGRPSKALTLNQAVTLLETVESGTHRLTAYVVVAARQRPYRGGQGDHVG
jgi:hypothetical protein